MPLHASTRDSLADESDGARKVTHDQLRVKAQDPIAERCESVIPARIGLSAGEMRGAVDLDDETTGGSIEVGDEAPSEWNLATEGDAELLGREGMTPEEELGGSGGSEHGASAESEERTSRG